LPGRRDGGDVERGDFAERRRNGEQFDLRHRVPSGFMYRGGASGRFGRADGDAGRGFQLLKLAGLYYDFDQQLHHHHTDRRGWTGSYIPTISALLIGQ